MLRRDKSIVPSLMFHSVGLENHTWTWSYISESVTSFESKVAALVKRGFQGVHWSDLYGHMAGQRRLSSNSIMLTFDDGYLDNWINVYPILKRYGMKATIFVTSDFVDPGLDARPMAEYHQANQSAACVPEHAGFLNWSEMREMQESGLIDIQSHGKTHTWYFSGPKIADFHRPHRVNPYPWLFWNARPDRKPYYLTEDQQEFLAWGYPILEHEKAMSVRRYFADEDAVSRVTEFVRERGGAEFFDHDNWRSLLIDHVTREFGAAEIPGRYESDEERINRINSELLEPKRLIEKNLSKPVEYLCWPGGAYREDAEAMAARAGYRSWTSGSKRNRESLNRPGADPGRITRIGTSNRLVVKGRHCGEGGACYMSLRVLAHQRSIAHAIALKLYKLAALLRSYIGGEQ